MTQTNVDPFATAPGAASATGDDPFASPRSTFPNMDWIVGRLVLCYPTQIKKDLPGNDRKSTYNAIVADVHVLDGDTITDGDTPLSIPGVLDDFRFNGEQFVDGMTKLVGTKRPYLCRIGEAPSKINRNVMARFPLTPTDADKVTAKAYMAGKGLL